MIRPVGTAHDDVRSRVHRSPHRTSPASLMPGKNPVRRRRRASTKLFVLDTNVLMHDPSSLFRFEEHDVYLPIGTLEELDNHKKGMSEVARNARQASRFLDEIVSDRGGRHATSKAGLPICRQGLGEAPTRGRLYLQTEAIAATCRSRSPHGQADNQILAVAQPPAARNAAKDGKAPGDPGVEGHQHAHQGARAGARRRGLLQRQGAGGHRPPLHRRAQAAHRFLGQHGKDMESWKKDGHTFYRVTRPAGAAAAAERVRVWSRRVRRAAALRARCASSRRPQDRGAARRCATTRTRKNSVWGITRATASRTSRSTC